MKVKPLRVGGLLANHTLQPVLLVYPRLGREKDSAPSWPRRVSAGAAAGSGGAGNGCTERSGSSRQSLRSNRSHKPCHEMCRSATTVENPFLNISRCRDTT